MRGEGPPFAEMMRVANRETLPQRTEDWAKGKDRHELADMLVAQAITLEAQAERIERLRALVNEQAEDEGLWFMAQTAPEGYLQQELRRLHAAIEAGESQP